MMNKMSSLTFPDGSTYEITDDKARKDITEINNNVNNIGQIVVDESLTVTITSRTTTKIKSVKNLTKGVYIATYRVIGLPQQFVIGTIKKNTDEIAVDCCFSSDQYMSAQSSITAIFTIESTTDEIAFEIMSGTNLENRAGQKIKIMRIA